MKDKTERIHVRIPNELKARIARVVDRTGIDEAALVRNCVEAICDHFDETGTITLQVTIAAGKSPPARAGIAATTKISYLTDKPPRQAK